MKHRVLTIVLLVLAVNYVQADSYETYAFGYTETEACEQAKSDLNDQAILQCRLNGGLLVKAEIGDCRKAESTNSRYKVLRSVKFTCRKE